VLHLPALVLSLLVSSPAAIDLPARRDAWTRVRTANFTLCGDARAAKIREVGLELERLRAVLGRSTAGGAATSPVPITIYVFRSPEALAPYLPRRDGRPMNVSAYYQQTEDASQIVLSAAWNSDPRPVVYHEYLHQFLRANFPPQPAWYEEGLAELYSTFQTQGDEAQTGRVRRDLLARLRSGALIPLERLLAVDHSSPEYNEREKQGVFYAEAWALVHYLTLGNPERTPQLGRYLGLIQSGMPRESAFLEAFETEPRVLLSELVAYVRSGRFAIHRMSVADVRFPQDARVEELPFEESATLLGELLANGDGDRLDEAARCFEAALQARPAHAAALGGLARVRLRQGRPGEAAPLLERALESGSADFRVSFQAGRLRMEELRGRPGPLKLDAEARASLEAARGAFRRSIALNPDFAEARVALGRTYMLEEGPVPEEGVAALEEAHRRLPARDDVALDLAGLYESRGEHEKADRVAATMGPAASRALEGSRRFGDVITRPVDEVNRLLDAGRDEEALAALDSFIARIGQQDVRDEMARQREALRRGIAKNRAAAEYNAAIELYNKRDYAAALPAFERVAADSPDAEIAGKARDMTEEIRRHAARTSTRASK
jgi:tetratricopeptide (TPR) repeat protein